MRLQGRITQWEDDKGFGFISWHGDGSRVFVHIKSFARGSRRPIIGDIVTYEIGEGKNGKSSATNVLFSDRVQASKKPVAKNKGGSYAGILVSLYMGLVFLAALTNRLSWLVLVIYFAASLLTFLAYAWDKSAARNDRWRTAENSLHLMSLLFGWPGALVAQRVLRHKSSKQEFLFVFWLTVFLNIGAVAYLVWLGDGSFINRGIEGIWRGVSS
tara:strand:+ start:56 stop:697 length:642 start_codon:yes stop_codon:yes gene_type:complete